MTSGATRRIAHLCIGALAGGITLAAAASVAIPAASADPDCSKAAVDGKVDAIANQAQSYLNAHPEGNKMLMTAALQPRDQAAATIAAYASTNPQEYADFKSILAPLGTLQKQCGVQVVPAQFQWAFDQFVG